MGALTSAVIAIVGLTLGWITIEIACKSCLEMGRDAIDRSLDPNYDPDDDDRGHPPLLNPPQEQHQPFHPGAPPPPQSSTVTEIV